MGRLRTLWPTGRIVLELPPNPTIANLPDVELEDGDRIIIPHLPSQVSVFGTVFNESSFLYIAEKTANDYQTRRQAAQGSRQVEHVPLRADGSVISAKQQGFLWASLNGVQVMLGEAIVVPENFERTTWVKDPKDWTEVLYQFGLGAAAIKVLQD